MRHKDFKVGMIVTMKDELDARGKVEKIGADSVIIKWDDLRDPCEHFEEEFDLIVKV